MIKGMARAARVFDEPDVARIGAQRRPNSSARRCGATAGCSRRTRTARAHLNAYLDDYAFLLDALLELMQRDFRTDDLEWAREIADVLLDQFEDARARRILFRQPRSRAAAASRQERTRQCDAVRQRHRGAGAEPARASRRRAALSRSRSAHAACVQNPAGTANRTRTPACARRSRKSSRRLPS